MPVSGECNVNKNILAQNAQYDLAQNSVDLAQNGSILSKTSSQNTFGAFWVISGRHTQERCGAER